ncbi:MAG: hypothetical protein J6K51_05020 [Clostridia bacterium]|nr:hypothetical protein [Clostridia bacterium]
MKRLIALLAGLAVLMSMSLTSFAAFTDAIELNADGTTYTAALTGDAATDNAGKQTTIVAYKGDTIDVGSIQYIDQAAADSFTFQLKDELTENVKVVMGGEAIDKQEVGTIFYGTQEDPTYTISGSVNNFVEQDFYDMLVADELIAAEDLGAYKAEYGTTAYLVDMDGAAEFVDGYGDELVITAIATCEVSAVDGTYAFEDVAAGEYAVIIYRAGSLPYMEYATVEDADVDMGAIDMIHGDFIGSKDFMIDSGDTTMLFGAMGDITETDVFVASYDIEHDCLTDSADLTIVFANMGDITAYGTDLIIDFFS